MHACMHACCGARVAGMPNSCHGHVMHVLRSMLMQRAPLTNFWLKQTARAEIMPGVCSLEASPTSRRYVLVIACRSFNTSFADVTIYIVEYIVFLKAHSHVLEDLSGCSKISFSCQMGTSLWSFQTKCVAHCADYWPFALVDNENALLKNLST